MDRKNNFSELCAMTEVLDDELLNALKDFSQYNSMGTLNWTVDLVTILRDRIAAGQRISYQGAYLTEEQFRELIQNNFGSYVYNGVYATKNLNHKVFFKLENTDQGMDLIYTGDKENSLFQKIADLNEFESLVRLLPNNVVYICNQKNGQFTPFLTEHNSCYVYDETDGRIKEYLA